MKRAVSLCAILAMSCSTPPQDIAPVPVSQVQPQMYDCEHLAAESAPLVRRANQLGGTKEDEAEYVRLKEEYEALRQVAAQNGCPTEPLPIAVTQPVSGGSTVPASALQAEEDGVTLDNTY